MKPPPAAYKLADRVRRLYWRVFKPTTTGVRVAAFQDGHVLLVRHTYMRGWYLPGGGLKGGETLEQAARRELREETGLEDVQLALAGAFTNVTRGKTDHVLLFHAPAVSGPLAPSSPEIAEARWFPLDALPPLTAQSTRRRIAALAGSVTAIPTGRW